MSLIQLSKTNPESFENYLARQIVAFAGDGNLRDNSECAEQFRAYLRASNRGRLERYAQECLEQPFPDSGFVLQDVVNELGRRLEFDVENGRYRGTTNAIGFDGIWRVPNGPTIIVEVKTTDTYNVSLESIAQYRNKLISAGLAEQNASLLFVVGRKDTGALEAQIRGSRYAWDMRVVGVDSLMKLVTVKEKSSEDQTVVQIRELLQPFEYTRVDRILDVVFSATIDAVTDEQQTSIRDPSLGSDDSALVRTPQKTIEVVRLKAIDALNNKLGLNLVRRRQALFEDRDGEVRACATVSKRYDDKLQPYWYAYHPKWDEFLAATGQGYIVFGCVDRPEAFAIPLDRMRDFLPSLNQTVRPDGGTYWHVKFSEGPTGLILFASKTGQKFDLSEYRITLPE
jgi:hypothetical protein